jgi:hypothetical protein
MQKSSAPKFPSGLKKILFCGGFEGVRDIKSPNHFTKK